MKKSTVGSRRNIFTVGSRRAKYCEVCSRISFELSDSRCESCIKFTHQNIQNFNPFPAMNNMEPGLVPSELSGLTYIEQILISRVKVVKTVFRLHGGQYGYNGQVINFNQDVSVMATSLPHFLNSLSNILIVRRGSDDVFAFKEFRVRKNVVWNALYFLIRSALRALSYYLLRVSPFLEWENYIETTSKK